MSITYRSTVSIFRLYYVWVVGRFPEQTGESPLSNQPVPSGHQLVASLVLGANGSGKRLHHFAFKVTIKHNYNRNSEAVATWMQKCAT